MSAYETIDTELRPDSVFEACVLGCSECKLFYGEVMVTMATLVTKYYGIIYMHVNRGWSLFIDVAFIAFRQNINYIIQQLEFQITACI